MTLSLVLAGERLPADQLSLPPCLQGAEEQGPVQPGPLLWLLQEGTCETDRVRVSDRRVPLKQFQPLVRLSQHSPGSSGLSCKQEDANVKLSSSAQVNRFNKSTDRALLITDVYVYKLDPNKQNKVLKRLLLTTVSSDTGTHTHTRTRESKKHRPALLSALMGAHRDRTGTPEDMAKLHPPFDKKLEHMMELRFPLASLHSGLAQYANVCSLSRPTMSQMGIPH